MDFATDSQIKKIVADSVFDIGNRICQNEQG